MYKKETQLAFEDFVFPFGELDSENEWVKLAGLIPWDTVEREYAKQFVDNGHPAHSARIALGALVVSRVMRKKVSRQRKKRVVMQWRNRREQPPGASCSCISCCPTECLRHGAGERRGALGRNCRQGRHPRGLSPILCKLQKPVQKPKWVEAAGRVPCSPPWLPRNRNPAARQGQRRSRCSYTLDGQGISVTRASDLRNRSPAGHE